MTYEGKIRMVYGEKTKAYHGVGHKILMIVTATGWSLGWEFFSLHNFSFSKDGD